MTPLCAVCIRDNTEMGQLLIEAGARANIPDNRKNLPIHYTARNKNATLTASLLDHGNMERII